MSLGQGVNSALEDVRVLDEVLGECSGDEGGGADLNKGRLVCKSVVV